MSVILENFSLKKLILICENFDIPINRDLPLEGFMKMTKNKLEELCEYFDIRILKKDSKKDLANKLLSVENLEKEFPIKIEPKTLIKKIKKNNLYINFLDGYAKWLSIQHEKETLMLEKRMINKILVKLYDYLPFDLNYDTLTLEFKEKILEDLPLINQILQIKKDLVKTKKYIELSEEKQTLENKIKIFENFRLKNIRTVVRYEDYERGPPGYRCHDSSIREKYFSEIDEAEKYFNSIRIGMYDYKNEKEIKWKEILSEDEFEDFLENNLKNLSFSIGNIQKEILENLEEIPKFPLDSMILENHRIGKLLYLDPTYRKYNFEKNVIIQVTQITQNNYLKLIFNEILLLQTNNLIKNHWRKTNHNFYFTNGINILPRDENLSEDTSFEKRFYNKFDGEELSEETREKMRINRNLF